MTGANTAMRPWLPCLVSTKLGIAAFMLAAIEQAVGVGRKWDTGDIGGPRSARRTISAHRLSAQ